MRAFGTFLCIFTLLLSVVETADAGVLAARRPGTESPVYNLRISHIRTHVDIVGQLAVTHVDEEFHNDNNMTLEGFYAFQLPEGAKVDGLWLWVDGKRLIFTVKPKEEAERLYDSVVVGQRRDPAILESLGKNRFQLKIFPINPHSSRRIEIRYFTTLPLTEEGYVHYRYPLNLQGYQSQPVEMTALTVDVSSQLPVGDFRTNFDGNASLCRTTRYDDRNYRVEFGSENQFYSQDFELSFLPENMFDFFPALSWQNPENEQEDGYFMTWHPVRLSEDGTAPRDLVFVLDESGSMQGPQIGTVREAVVSILRRLRPVDRFRLVTFSSFAESWPAHGEMTVASEANIESAVEWIERSYGNGGSTNYETAFREALAGDFREEAVRRMLFLTDGMPNMGMTSTDQLLALIEQLDHSGVGIYPVIVYSDRIDQLYDIAAARGGKVTIVENGDGLQTVISRIMLELSIGTVSAPVITYESGQTAEVYPKSFSMMPGVDRLITTGRLIGPRPELIRMTFKDTDGTPRELLRSVDFSQVRTDVRQVASYWAAKRIDDLLEQHEQASGEAKEEIREQIVRLSIRHMILTPFTAFLVLETNPIDPPTAVAEQVSAPAGLQLGANYPNPFSPAAHGLTTIPFALERHAAVRIVITDVLGRVLRVLQEGMLGAGRHRVSWNGRDETGGAVTPGVYFVRVTSGATTLMRRLTVIR